MFYKTTNGAAVGDVYMSLIHTCVLCRVNPFEYLQALQIHVDQVTATPALWLPWNYPEQLAAAQARATRSMRPDSGHAMAARHWRAWGRLP